MVDEDFLILPSMSTSREISITDQTVGPRISHEVATRIQPKPGSVPEQDLQSPNSRQIILFIQECGFILEARELTVATACMLFHKYKGAPCRFLPVSSPKEEENEGEEESSHQDETHSGGVADHYLVATSCLLLAGKIEENHLNIRRLINIAYRTFFRDKELTEIDEYYGMRRSILTLELWLLRLVGFHPVWQHPQPYMVCFLKACQDWLPRDEFTRQPVAATCWSILKDAYLSDVVVREKAEHLAVAVVASALQLLKISVPAQDVARRSWTRACCHDLSSDHLERIVTDLLQLYH